MPATSRSSQPAETSVSMEQYWTTSQVADRLHVTVDGVKKWLKKGQLRKVKAGSKTLITETDLQQFIAESTRRSSRQAA